MDDRILQIIPAPPNMWVKWEPEADECEVDFAPVVCLALKEFEGGTYVTPMVAF